MICDHPDCDYGRWVSPGRWRSHQAEHQRTDELTDDLYMTPTKNDDRALDAFERRIYGD